MSRISGLIACWLCLFLSLPSVGAAERPDVLFIAIDDLNDAITLFDRDAPIRTPHLEEIARRGVLFTRAYCASPACNPSRVAVLTGRRPSTTGVYGNRSDWRAALPEAATLMQQFMAAGYRVEGAGKIFHHHAGGAFHDRASFHDFLELPDPPDRPMPASKLNGLDEFGSANTDWGAWPPAGQTAVDVRTVDDGIARLKQRRSPDQSLFLAVGIFRPHMPFFAPQQAFDRYPTAEIALPALAENDLDDVPAGGRRLWSKSRWFWDGMTQAESAQPGTWREAVAAYYACASFADEQIGRLIAALDETGRAKNTVIVVWSDHGYHLGEKQHWEKFTLWEKATHVPLIIVAPGVAQPGTRCDRPVDLTAIYPTLMELCGIPAPDGLDGVSVLPLLKQPGAAWERPAVMTYLRGNHAVRSERWRYIRYADGTEELYDHASDAGEITNLADRAEHRTVLAEHRRWLPKKNAPAVRNLGNK